MNRPAARLIPIFACLTLLAAGVLGVAWISCLPAPASDAAGPDSPRPLGLTYLEMNAQAVIHHPGCVPGALVTAVRPGGAADLAGLRAGDTVVGVDGRLLDSDWTLLQGLLDRQDSGQMTVAVRRGEITISLPITLATRQ